MSHSTDGVTVIVPTLNREAFLGPTLKDLLEQDHAPLEILVVDQSVSPSSTARTLAGEHPSRLVYHHVTFRGLPLARNFGWQNARNEAILYVDDDIRCPPDLVREHLQALRRPGVGVVAGGIEEPNRPRPATPEVGRFRGWTATPVAGFSWRDEKYVDHARGCNFSTWKRVLRETGGFDESLNVGAALFEELEYCLRVRRAGYRILFQPRAHLTHLVAPSDGCRVPDPRRYARSFFHNQSIVIRRHLRWYEKLTALAYQGNRALVYAWLNRDPLVIPAALSGTWHGLRRGGRSVSCTAFVRDSLRNL
jgi:GT2 family glycosyltransferase